MPEGPTPGGSRSDVVNVILTTSQPEEFVLVHVKTKQVWKAVRHPEIGGYWLPVDADTEEGETLARAGQ